MRWCVRRYQNEDGTLAEEGKQRYREEIEREYKIASDELHSAQGRYAVATNAAERWDRDTDASGGVQYRTKNRDGSYTYELNGRSITTGKKLNSK